MKAVWLCFLAVTGLAAIAAVLIWSFVPVSRETTIAYRDGWRLQVAYPPNRQQADIQLRMDGMSRFAKVTYRVQSSVSWAPQWHGTIEGESSEFITLSNGSADTPEVMTPTVAKRLARSYTVAFTGDGKEYVIDFSDAPLMQPIPLFDRLLHAWPKERLIH